MPHLRDALFLLLLACRSGAPRKESFTMTMYEKLPKDPVMLLSFINTQLRDTYESFEAFAIAYQVDADATIATMKSIDYEYDPAVNQFI